MATLSVRGLNPKALATLKTRAAQQGASVNSLVVKLIESEAGASVPARQRRRRHADLDALAGTWDKADARGFAKATAAFGEVDAALWK